MAELIPHLVWSLAVIAAALASVHAATKSIPYEFNAVAVTGGGYITGIIAHPTEADLLYARTDIGSSYRWNQTLNKWIPLTDFISAADSNLFGTETFALDPHDSSRLYLAQGRYLSSNNSAFFVSDDQGRSFDVYPAPFPMGANELGRNNGERMAVNPFDGDELWIGTRTEGLWRSSDGARSWVNVTNFPEAFANTIGLVSVIFDPLNEGTIYVSANVPNGIYFTVDGGSNWDALPGQPQTWENSTLFEGKPASSTGPQPMKVALASNGALYVTYADFPGPYGVNYGYVYMYNTSSSEWTNITPGPDNSFPPPYSNQTFPAGGYCGLSIDSKDPKTLVVVTLDRDPGPALDSMYLTHDGGETWKDVSQLSTPPGSGGYWGHPIAEAALKNGTAVPWLSFDWGGEWGGYGAPSPIYGLTKFGWWMSAVLIDPFDSDHVMYGTGATVWSTDSLSSVDSDEAPEWYIQAQGIEETYALSATSPTSGAHLLSGFGDMNGFKHDDLDVPQPMFGLPTYSNLYSLDFAGQKPNIIVRTGNRGIVDPSGCGNAAYSTDGGDGWELFHTCAPGINETVTTTTIMAIDASGDHQVWSTLLSYKATDSQTGPWASSDLGATWQAPLGLSVQTPNISADRVQPATFYSFTDGVWYSSTDGGRSYNSSLAGDIGLPAEVGGLPVVNFNVAGEIWLPLDTLGLYHTTDFGASWEQLGGPGLTAHFFSAGAPAKRNSTLPALFLWGSSSIETPEGLYRSDDNGASWVRVNDDTHQYGGPTLIQADPRVYGRVFIGTGGRGIIRADFATGGNQTGNIHGTGGI